MPSRLAVQSATPPTCTKCGHNKRVVRLWHGGVKMWVCRTHFKITSTKRKEATLKDRLLHRLPEPDTYDLDAVLPNRAARRRRTR